MFNKKSILSSVLAALSADSSSVSKSALVGSAVKLMSILVVISFAATPACDANDGLTEAGRLVNQGCDFDDAGKVDEAISCYKKAIALEPRDDTAYFDLGTDYLGNKHDDVSAKFYLQKAIDINPHEAKYWDQLGLALAHLKDVTAAEAAYML